MSLYKQEFPDYDRKLYIPDGWIDSSYHNDMMPRVVKDFGKYRFSIWQNYRNPDLRESCEDAEYIFDIQLDDSTVIFSYLTNSLVEINRLMNSIDY